MLYLYFIVYVCLPVNVESASPIFITLYPFSFDILKFLSTLIFVIFALLFDVVPSVLVIEFFNGIFL